MPIIRDVIAVVAPLFAVIIAWLGLQTWRKQLKGNKSYELSLKMLAAVYKVRNAIYNTRQHPLIGVEVINALNTYGIENNNKINDAEVYKAVYNLRWDKVMQCVAEYDVIKNEVEVLWGDEVINKFEKFEMLFKKMYVQILKILSVKKTDDILKLLHENPPNILFYISDEDAFSIEFKNAIKDIEVYLWQKMKV